MEQGNFRELNELKVILPYQIENFEENETLLFFDKILLANFNELKSYQMNTFILNESINDTLQKIEEVQKQIKILEEKENG